MKRRKQRLSVLLAALLTVSVIFNSPIVYAVEDGSADVPEAVAVSDPTDDAVIEGESGDALIDDEESAAIEDESAYVDEDEAARGGLVAEEESDGLVALAENATAPTKFWVEPSETNNILQPINLFKQKSGRSYVSPTDAYLLFLPGNVDLNSCFLSWDGGATVTVNGQTYESGALPIPALESRTNFTFNYGYQQMTIAVIAYQGSSSVHQIFINIDESQGTIANMKSSKSNECKGEIFIDGTSYELSKMKGRGNASWEAAEDKKPYNITLGKKITFPGTDSEPTKKWTLLAESLDRSILGNRSGFFLAQQMGIGQSTTSADVWMNGEYQGLYNVTPKTDSYVSKDGFQIEQDNYKEDSVYNGGDPQFALDGMHGQNGNWASVYNLITVKKIGDNLLNGDETPQNLDNIAQNTIKPWLQDAWDAIRSSNGYNSKGKYYTDYIDIESFAKMYLMQEYVKNYDVCAGSLLYYRNGMTDSDKLYAGPIWDLDNALGSTCQLSDLGQADDRRNGDRRSAEGDFIKNITEYKTSLYKALGRHSDFLEEVTYQYNKNKAAFNGLDAHVEQLIDEISASAAMNYRKVEEIGNSQYKNLHYYSSNTTLGSWNYRQSYQKTDGWSNYTANLRTYIQTRSLWFANNYTDPNYHDHVYGEGEITTPATCTEPGVMTYTCTICGEQTTEVIPASGHMFNEETGVCEVCGIAAPKATIACGEGASVTVYMTKDLSGDCVENATVAFPRDGNSGSIDISGDGQVNFVVNLEPGYELVGVTAEPTSSYKNLKVQDDGSYRITKVTGDLTINVTTTVVEPIINGHNLLLSSEIGVQFKAIFPDGFDTTGSYMGFSASDGRTGEMQLSDATKVEGQNVYWFTSYVNALGLADTITATLHYGTDGTVEDTYSAISYINAAKEKYPDRTKLINIVNALQDYGYYLQESGWTDGRTHEHIDPISTLGPDSIAAAKAGVSGKAVEKILEGSGISDAKFSLTLNSDTAINVYVKPDEGVTVTSSNATLIGPRKIGGQTYYQYETEKIGAANLGKTYTINFNTSTGGTASVKASAMSYVHAVLNDDSFTEAKKLAMTAYYNYHVAADADTIN